MASRRCMRRLSTVVLPARPTIADMVPSLTRLKLADSKYMLPGSTPISAAAEHLLDKKLTFALVYDDVKMSDAQSKVGHKSAITESTVVGMITERNILQYATSASDVAFFSGREKGSPPTSQWMTPRDQMLCARLDSTLDSALNLVHTGIWRHLPVLDYYGNLHSILDIRDVLQQSVGEHKKEVAWKGCAASDILGMKRKSRILEAQSSGGDLYGSPAEAGAGWHDALSAYLLSHAKRHTISVRASVEDAAKQMREEQLTFLVVRDVAPKSGTPERVVGLINERSFLSFCKGDHPDGAKEPVSSVMTPLESVLHVSLTDPASKVIDLFFNKNVRHLPVIDNRAHLAGIISVRDLLRPLINGD